MAASPEQVYPSPDDRHHDYHDEQATRGLTPEIPFGYRIDASPALKPGFFVGTSKMTTPNPAIQGRPFPNCRNCAVPMEPGFQIDRGDSNAIRQASWVPGGPTPLKFWTGMSEASREQANEALRVVSFRCPECGLLDCYANDPVKPQ